jgi:hypothetical protein
MFAGRFVRRSPLDKATEMVSHGTQKFLEI